MTRTPVSSSNLSSIGYDDSSGTLEIAFKTGGVYQYHNIPGSIYLALMAAPSHGTYFDRNIKRGGYSFTKIG